MSSFGFVTPELEKTMLGILAANRIDPTHKKMEYGQMEVCRDAFKKEHWDEYMQIITKFSKGEFEGWIKTLYWKHKKQYVKPPRKRMVLDADIETARAIEIRTKEKVLPVNHRGLPQVYQNTVDKAKKLGFTIVGSKDTRLYQIREGNSVVAGESWDLKPTEVVKIINTAVPKLVGEPSNLIGLSIQDLNKKLKKVVDIVGEGKEIEKYRKQFARSFQADQTIIAKWCSEQKLRHDRNHKKFEFTINDAVCQLIKRYLEKQVANKEATSS